MTSIKMPDHLLAGTPATENGTGRHTNGAFDLEIASLVTTDESVWNLRAPVIAWLVASVQPTATVDIDLSGDSQSLGVSDLIGRFVPSGSCLSVPSTPYRTGSFGTGPVSSGARTDEPDTSTPTYLDRALEEAPASIDLLHIRLAQEAEENDVPVEGWLARLHPGSVVVLSWTAGGSDRSAVWKEVSDRYPLISIDEAQCAYTQVPIEGQATLVDVLAGHPAMRAQLSLLAERGEYRYVTGLPLTPNQLREEIEHLRACRVAEAEAAREGLARLRQELATALQERREAEVLLVEERQHHTAELRAMSQRVMEEARAEADSLAAKVATSAAKYERKIAEIEAAAGARQAEFELQLGAALREIADIRASTSWRLTAGVRALGSAVRRFPRR